MSPSTGNPIVWLNPDLPTVPIASRPFAPLTNRRLASVERHIKTVVTELWIG